MEYDDATALSVRGLSRRFGERQALHDVSFDLAAGELAAVIGPNGAGKTTLLSILAGALSASAGRVDRVRTGRHGRSVGWVPQQPAIYSKLSVLENLRLFARLERVPDPEHAVQAMLEQTGLEDRATERVGRLSGGNQQRVNIAVGLLSEPAVLLLDEPSSALDPRQRARLWEFVSELAGQGTAVLYSTHDVLEAQRHAGRVLALEEGRLMFAGTPAEMDWDY
ncbi:MAG TPA: ABC transporter ATP-binding protein [Solirubrobacteraceae bacterium]|nr:ABC transporter ATP-binding protein [Solirubrobacteraceae bacterium]